jgi:hypothetical protein
MNDTIGFYALLQSQDGKGYLGALLVTDDLGKPAEFRVTYPVKPTSLQRQLYGDSMVPHIGVELCGKPLYQALKNKPLLLLVSDIRFLQLSASVTSLVVQVEGMGETLKVAGSSDAIQQAHAKLLSTSGRFQPLAVTCPKDYDDQRQAEALSQLNRFFAGIDLLEPFARIDAAAKALSAQDEKFR